MEMLHKRIWRDRWQFAQAFMANPSRVGAILPSSQALASAITAELKPGMGKVLELGSGTGVFTSYMIKRGFDPVDLILVEQDPALAESLRARYPRATILQSPAQTLDLRASRGRNAIAATICGLPLRNMTDDTHRRMLDSIFQAMPAGGELYLFTYGLHCPIAASTLDKLNLVTHRKGLVIKNLPPATIHCISRSEIG